MDLGITQIRRETFGSALELCQVALQILGTDPYEAHIFRKNDEEMMPELYKMHRQDEDSYVSIFSIHNHLCFLKNISNTAAMDVITPSKMK